MVVGCVDLAPSDFTDVYVRVLSCRLAEAARGTVVHMPGVCRRGVWGRGVSNL